MKTTKLHINMYCPSWNIYYIWTKFLGKKSQIWKLVFIYFCKLTIPSGYSYVRYSLKHLYILILYIFFIKSCWTSLKKEWSEVVFIIFLLVFLLLLCVNILCQIFTKFSTIIDIYNSWTSSSNWKILNLVFGWFLDLCILLFLISYYTYWRTIKRRWPLTAVNKNSISSFYQFPLSINTYMSYGKLSLNFSNKGNSLLES